MNLGLMPLQYIYLLSSGSFPNKYNDIGKFNEYSLTSFG
jgi:hypothetical protein